jgi:hypothetical protein
MSHNLKKIKFRCEIETRFVQDDIHTIESMRGLVYIGDSIIMSRMIPKGVVNKCESHPYDNSYAYEFLHREFADRLGKMLDHFA